MPTGKDHAARNAAKYVPHRKTNRVYSARADVKADCEQLLVRLKNAPLSQSASDDVTGAVHRVLLRVNAVNDKTEGARAFLSSAAKEVTHVASAYAWVAHANRTCERLGDLADTTKENLNKSCEVVLHMLRTDVLDGALTSATAHLQEMVSAAETKAANVNYV